MAKVTVRLNSSGVRKLLRSQEMMNICTKQAYKARAKLGNGYVVTYQTGGKRVNASIAANTMASVIDNLRNNTILKALRGDGNDN